MPEPNAVIEAAQKYVADSAEFKTMRDIGKVLGVSSHVVGRALKSIGLRTPEGKPTENARDCGYVRTVPMMEGFYLDIWHAEKTLRVLRPLIESSKP